MIQAEKKYPLGLLFILGVLGFSIALSYPIQVDAAPGKRQKVIDFEDEVVEGLNKRPLDSLSEIAERNRKHRKPHLYRKRVSFRSEVAETLRVSKFTP